MSYFPFIGNFITIVIYTVGILVLLMDSFIGRLRIMCKLVTCDGGGGDGGVI